MKFTHLAFAIASLGGAVAIAAAAPAHADIRWNGPVLNGVTLNGPVLQGINLNGVTLNGPVLQGPVLQGLELNGMRMNGAERAGAKAEINSCQPAADQTCEPRVRAVVLPTGQRMGLK